MADETARFALPFILPGQAQKELFHNEALARIDTALHASIEDAETTLPPSSMLEGQCWIVGEGASDAWEGRAGQLAAWTSGGWRYLTPQAGMLVWNRSIAQWIYFNGSEWSLAHCPSQGSASAVSRSSVRNSLEYQALLVER